MTKTQKQFVTATEILVIAARKMRELVDLPREVEANLGDAFGGMWGATGNAMLDGESTLEDHDLWALCGRLGRLVEAQTPGSELARQFAEALVQEVDGETPDVEAMAAAVAAFDGLLEQERRQILSGWSPIERSDRQEYEGVTHHVAFMDALDLEVVDGIVAGGLAVVPDYNGLADVRLTVAIGTPRGRVLAGLDAIKAKLESDWQVLTAPAAAAAEVAA